MAKKFSNAFKKGKIYNALFCALFVLFLIVGIFSAGSFRSTGKAYYNSSDKAAVAVFDLNVKSGQKLKSVHVNVGSVYAPVGADVTLTVKRYSSNTNTSSSASYTFGTEQRIGNVYSKSKQGMSGKLFNWLEVTEEASKIVKAISIKTDYNVEINEIVCLDDEGNKIPLSVNTNLTRGYAKAKTALAPAFDAQNSFTNSLSARYNFTQEEAYTLSAVRNLLQGSSFNTGDVYVVDKNFNALGTLVYVPFIAIFGTSVGALRLPALLASAAAVYFLWAFFKLLFKDEKCALVSAALFAFGGLALTVGTTGTPFAIVLSALCGSLYFAYRFFAKGISYAHVFRGVMNVLFSGVFAAVAIAIDLLAVLPVAGILVLFFFGMRRMKRAHENELTNLSKADERTEETNETTEADEDAGVKEAALAKKIRTAEVQYAYKKRVTAAFAALSFGVVTFILIILSGVLSYAAYVKAFDTPDSPTLGFGSMLWKGLSSAWTKGNITSFTADNAAIAFAWFLPLKPATLYATGAANGAGGAYVAKHAFINPVLAVAAFVSLVFVSVRFVQTLKNGVAENKSAMRTVRGYIALVGGVLLTLVYGLVCKNTSAATAYLFYPLYLALIPFAYKTWKDGAAVKTEVTETNEANEAETNAEENKDNAPAKTANKAADTVFYVVLGLAAVCFLASVPAVMGFGVGDKLAQILFGWMNVINNGFFRI